MEKVKNFWKKYWVTFLIFAGMVVAYCVMSASEAANSYLFPTGKEILDSFIENREIFAVNLISSFSLLIPSVTIAVVLSIAIGVPIGLNKRVREAIYPVLYTISVIPSILLSPFALMLAPNFRAASLFLIIYGCMFPTVFATITGIQTIDKRYLDNADTLGLTGVKKLTKVILPAASPSIFSGLVTTMRGSFLMLAYAEMYGAKYGMGFFVRKYSEYGMYQHTWSGFIFMVLVLVIVMQIFEAIKSHVLKWSIN
ncbi:MAG: ABC transporter permease subunit [Lachnospiraceae bacterium]|nr:ABC transporter permease subunit [Lachnospiraceae bacterium]